MTILRETGSLRKKMPPLAFLQSLHVEFVQMTQPVTMYKLLQR